MAVPFIQHDGKGLKVCEEGIRVISGIQGKLAVVAVAGPYRTGKSFLLNQFIKARDQHQQQQMKEGFQVGGTVNACTKGIWVWGQPIEVPDPLTPSKPTHPASASASAPASASKTKSTAVPGVVSSNKTTYIFLDTEGLGSLDQNATFDTQTFSLALLLSSLFLLNTQGTISESALEQLELVVECSKQIRIRESDKGETTAADLAAHFPAFMWVLRDFVLELQDERGEAITSREYLEKALRPQNSGRHTEEKNRIRQVLSTVFPRRDCETLVRPVLDERELQKLNSLPADKLRYFPSPCLAY